MEKKNVLLSCVFLAIVLLSQGAIADESWQGNAAIIRKGEFTQSGLYAASNSFTTNTIILVEDLNTGKTVSATVVKRIEGTSNVFLLLSEDCGMKLGMKPGDVIQVKVSIIKPGSMNYFTANEELPYNPDPDLYPKTNMTDETDTGFNGEDITVTYATPTPGVIVYVTPTPTPMPFVVVTPTPPEILTGTPTPSTGLIVGPTPTPTPTTPVVLNESEARDPQKNLFLPPRDNEKFVLDDLVRPETEKTDDKTNDLELKEAKVTENKETASGTIEKPKAGDKGQKIDKKPQDPELDNPELTDRTYLADTGKTELRPTDQYVPEPEYMAESPKHDTVEVALNPEEPKSPTDDGKFTADPSEERLKPDAKESKIAISPDNPPPVQDPELSNAKPTPAKTSDTKITLESTEPKPPKGTDAHVVVNKTPTPTPTIQGIPTPTPKIGQPTPVPKGTPVPTAEKGGYALALAELKRGTYFVQLGTYTDKDTAITVGTQYANVYPIGIFEPPKTSRVFKLLLGPLNKDESDTLLYRFRAIGFKDAFVKYIN